VESAVKILELYNCVITPNLKFKIGISAGFPVTKNGNFFESTIKEASYLSYTTNDNIILSPEVKVGYESENLNNSINISGVAHLTAVEREFVVSLFEYTETIWQDSNTSALDFGKNLGLSKSNLYRTIMPIMGKSPNIFLRDYRLDKALELLDKNVLNISEIAYQTGFSSPTYFSKCFYEAYGILPSKYIKMYASPS
jgi:AraC-like DNA-binding protein